jgi:hypothetical protein
MAMTRNEWNALQASLPEEDRQSYEDYLASLGGTTPTTPTPATPEPTTPFVDSPRDPTADEPNQPPVTDEKTLAEGKEASSTGPSAMPWNYPPGDAPYGFVWKWIGARTVGQAGSGSWKLYRGGPGAAGGAAGGADGGGVGGGAGPTGATGPGSAGPTGPTGPTTTYTAPDGRIFTDLDAYNAYIEKLNAEEKRRIGQSAYDLLYEQFNEFGLGGLVEALKGFVVEGLSKAEFTLRLRDTDAYKKRFAANQSRIQKGLRALSEAEYIQLEDEYQERMRRYGLPESYYARGEMGRQEGFEKFIANDVSPVELEDRIQTAQRRVMNAAPQIKDALSQFYGDEISNGDILAYVLDPSKAIEGIKRKVTAAEIGAGAKLAGLGTTRTRAEELEALGVTGERAREGFQAIGGFLPRASQLGDIYGKAGMGPYTQATAEAEVFGTAGAVDAERKRRQLAQLETAQFSGQIGTAGGALGRERAGQF